MDNVYVKLRKKLDKEDVGHQKSEQKPDNNLPPLLYPLDKGLKENPGKSRSKKIKLTY